MRRFVFQMKLSAKMASAYIRNVCYYLDSKVCFMDVEDNSQHAYDDESPDSEIKMRYIDDIRKYTK